MKEAYLIQNLALQKYAQGCPLNEVMDVLTNGIEERFPDSLCSILILNDENKSLHSCSSPSLPFEFVQAINGMKIGPLAGSCGSAAYKKELVVIEDMKTDPLCKNFKDFILLHKLQSCWSHPIFSSKKEVLGTFAIYNKIPSKVNKLKINFTSSLAFVAGIVLEGKKSLRKLEESEDRFKSIMNQAADAFIVHDMEGKFIDVNKRACLSLGYSREELLNMSVPDVEKKNRPEKLKKLWEELCLGTSITLQGEHCRKDGTRFPVEVNLGQIKMNNQNYFLASARDVTERKRNEDYLSTIANNTTSVIYMKDLEGRYLLINKRWENIFNVKSQEVLGKTDFELFPKEIAENFIKIDKEVMLSGKTFEGEEFAPHDDELHTYISIKVPLKDSEGVVYGICGVSTDITERKKMENKIKRSNEELESFASIASHDLQEPLRKISLFSGRLKDLSPNLDDKCTNYLNKMTNSAERMKDLIDDLLSFSKITIKGQPFEQVDLNLVAKESLGNLEVLMRETKGAVKWDNLPTILADSFQMTQLFQNLISNSLKYHQNDIPPDINIYSKQTNKNKLEIFFEDNGIGFEEKYAGKIFQPFQRLHGRSEFSGTGIGLAICQKIIDRHSGSIKVKSTPNKGSTFIITFHTSKSACI